MISATPNQLVIYDPVAKTQTAVALPLVPTALGLSPDGMSAAVGHDGSITLVNLANASLVKNMPVSCQVLNVILPGNGFAYALPLRDQWTSIRVVNISTGVETQVSGGLFYAGTLGVLNSKGDAVYTAQNGLSPDHMQRWKVTSTGLSYSYDWPYHGTYS